MILEEDIAASLGLVETPGMRQARAELVTHARDAAPRVTATFGLMVTLYRRLGEAEVAHQAQCGGNRSGLNLALNLLEASLMRDAGEVAKVYRGLRRARLERAASDAAKAGLDDLSGHIKGLGSRSTGWFRSKSRRANILP